MREAKKWHLGKGDLLAVVGWVTAAVGARLQSNGVVSWAGSIKSKCFGLETQARACEARRADL